MKTIAGKTFFDTLKEIVDPRHAALIVVDMQNDFCSPDGVFGKAGADCRRVQSIVPAIQHLLELARSKGVAVIFMRHTHEENLSNVSPARLSFYQMLYDGTTNPFHAIRGTWGWQVIDELKPQKTDMVLDKGRSSAFIATSLDQYLRSNAIQSVVLTGMATHACVESTARDAGFFDYYTVVIEDAVADYKDELHNASLLTLRQRALVRKTSEIAELWT